MGTSKVNPAGGITESRIKEIQQQLGEREDALHREHVREWILQLADERMKRELADHDQLVAECEKQSRAKAGGS